MARIGWAVLAVLALVLLALWWQRPLPPPELRDAALPDGSSLQWSGCSDGLDADSGLACGWLTRPDGGGGEIELPVVVVFAGRDRSGPLLYLPGGPGQSSWLDSYGGDGWAEWLRQVGWRRDFILMDPRGVGIAKPAIQCPGLSLRRLLRLERPLGVSESWQEELADYEACLARLARDGHALDRYSTAASADDVEALLALLQQSLGYQGVRLYGVSYGTRLALELLRRAPPQLAGAVLDSAYPPEVDGALSWPESVAFAFAAAAERCLADSTDCGSALRQRGGLAALLAALDKKPWERELRLPYSELPVRVSITGGRLLEILLAALAAGDPDDGIASGLSALLAGDPEALDELAADWAESQLWTDTSEAVLMTVECRDGVAHDEAAFQAAVAAQPEVAAWLPTEVDVGFCERHGLSLADPSFPSPVQSRLPTLVIAGGLDPITPPRWSQLALQGLSHSRLVIFPEAGHSVLSEHPCAQRLAAEFFDHLDPERLTACAGTRVSAGGAAAP